MPARSLITSTRSVEEYLPDQTEYLFPSDSQYITENDLLYWDQETTMLVRNEIFARHGYIFENQDLQAYFDSQIWYEPNPNFDTGYLNAIEKQNIETVKAFEYSQGWQ